MMRPIVRGWGMMRLLPALMVLLALSTAVFAQPAAPSTADTPAQPFLRLDGPFHTQIVNRIATDRNGRVVVSVSDDKTIRLWSAADGSLLGTIRVPIGDREEGELYAVALSPDGSKLLAGGHTGFAWDRNYAVYVFDVAQQRLLGRLTGLPGPANHIAFDESGTRVAVALGARGGIRVYDAVSFRLLFGDQEVRDRTTWVAFAGDGALVSVNFDGTLRRWDGTGKRTAAKPVGPGKPYSVAVSPDGGTLAVGYVDQARVALFDARTLAPKGQAAAPAGAAGAGGLSAVAWAPDGVLMAAGTVRNRNSETIVRAWQATSKAPVDWPVGRDTVAALLPLAGGVAVAAADPLLTLLGPDGRSRWTQVGIGFDLRGVADRGFRVSGDGMSVQAKPGGSPVTWRIDMAARTVDVAETAPAAAPLRGVTDWRFNPKPKIAGKPAVLEAEERSLSAASAASGMVLLGTDYYLRSYAPDGTFLAQIRTPAAAWGVGLSDDGTVAVAALGDGTLRWYGVARDGALSERIALMLTADGQRWIAWTPEGFFDHADRGGKELVGYQINRGKARLPDWYSFGQVYRLFYAPDLVATRLRTGDPAEGERRLAEIGDLRDRLVTKAAPRISLETVCTGAAGDDGCRQVPSSAVTRTLIPVAAPVAATPIVNVPNGMAAILAPGGAPPAPAPATGSDFDLPADAASLRLRFRLDDQGGGFGPADIFVNEAISGRLETPVAAANEITVPLSSGINRLRLRAYDAKGETYGESRVLKVTVAEDKTAGRDPTPAAPVASVAPAASPVTGLLAPASTPTAAPPAAEKPSLFVLSVGVDKYQNGVPNLAYAVADARAFVRALKEGQGNLWKTVELTELYDDAATTDAVGREMAKIGRKAKADDTVLIYLSGHGVLIDKRYYFVTYSVSSLQGITKQAFSEAALVQGLSTIRARNGMVFLDTCHAGAFTLLDSASQLAHESGRYVLAGAASVEEALDSYDNVNGVFATALIRGLRGAAAKDGSTVNNFDLGFFASPLVRKLAAEKNHTQSARFKIAADDAVPFPLVEVSK